MNPMEVAQNSMSGTATFQQTGVQCVPLHPVGLLRSGVPCHTQRHPLPLLLDPPSAPGVPQIPLGVFADSPTF